MRIALITGAAGGLGLASARKLEPRLAALRAFERNLALTTPYGRNERAGIDYPFYGRAQHLLVR